MRTLSIALLAIMSMVSSTHAAQPQPTQINDTIYGSDGYKLNGYVDIAPTSLYTYSGTYTIIGSMKRVYITNGTLYTTVMSNYGTSYLLNFSNGARMVCVFPASSGSIILSQYCSGTGYYTTLGSVGAATTLSNLNGIMNQLFR